jgi:hypothetical protein
MLGFLPASLAAAAAGGLLQQDSSYGGEQHSDSGASPGGTSSSGSGSIAGDGSSSSSSDGWGDQWQQWLTAQGLGLSASGAVGGEGAGGLAALSAVLRSSMGGLPPQQVWQLMQQQAAWPGSSGVAAGGQGEAGQHPAGASEQQEQDSSGSSLRGSMME